MVYRDDPDLPTHDNGGGGYSDAPHDGIVSGGGAGTRSRSSAEGLEIPQYRDGPSSSPDAGAYDYDDTEPNSVGSVGQTSPRRASRGVLILVACLVAALAIGMFVHDSKSGRSDTSPSDARKPLFTGTKTGVRGSSNDAQKGEFVAEINEEMNEVEGVKPASPPAVPVTPPPPAPKPKPEHTTHLPKDFHKDIDECEDDATYVHSNGKSCSTFIANVGRPALHEVRCNQGTGNFDNEGNEILLHHYCKKSCKYCTQEQAADSDAYHEKFVEEQEAMVKANAEKAAAEKLAKEQAAAEKEIVAEEVASTALIAAQDEEKNEDIQEEEGEQLEDVYGEVIASQDEERNSEDIWEDDDVEDEEEGDGSYNN